MTRRKFIVIYGANNLGKSTQVELLKRALEEQGRKVRLVKYPIYDLSPTGPKINTVLREGLKMDEKELQELFVQNRKDFEPTLKSYLESGDWVIAEDYKGTGIAWGLVRGVALEDLEEMNRDLLPEDLAILLYGNRFRESIEKNHKNETDDETWEKSQNEHLYLANRYGWIKVLANQTKEKVHQEIIQLLKSEFNL